MIVNSQAIVHNASMITSRLGLRAPLPEHLERGHVELRPGKLEPFRV